MQMLRRVMLRARWATGFTLIELLLVLVILAVLAAVAVPIYARHAEKARVDATKADIANLKTALDSFVLDNGRYPLTEEGLLALVRTPPGLEGAWHGPYIEQVIRDKWGRDYVYQYPASDEPNTFWLSSDGKDGESGTEDDITRYTVGMPAGQTPMR
jgi:general secretion pathway protein G